MAVVNGSAYVNFRNATDGLFSRVEHEDLANVLGVSVASIRQARLNPEANAHRAAPHHWRAAVLRLAEQRLEHYRELIEQLSADEAQRAPNADKRGIQPCQAPSV